jgi:hypothetical protein
MHPADEGAPCAFAALPQGLVHAIFVRVPVDTRLRCSEVCPAWRDTLMERSLWTRLDLSAASGVSLRAIDNAFLCAAAARAGGCLAVLDITGTGRMNVDRLIALDTLCDVLVANASTLRELHVSWHSCYVHDVERNAAPNTPAHFVALLQAAPLLLALHASEVHCTEAAEMRALLRNEPPFGPLRVQHVQLLADSLRAELDEEEVVAAVSHMAAHAWLRGAFMLGVVLSRA